MAAFWEYMDIVRFTTHRFAWDVHSTHSGHLMKTRRTVVKKFEKKFQLELIQNFKELKPLVYFSEL